MPAQAPPSPTPGDLVGLVDPRGPQLAIVQSLKGTRADLRVGFDGRSLQLPLRQLDRLAVGPDPASPARSLTHEPWRLTPEGLKAASPRLREIGAAWMLLADSAPGSTTATTDLAEFADLVAGVDDPVHRAACWLWLHGPQTLFRWRQQQVEPRPLADVRRLRRERRQLQLSQQRELRWHAALRERRPIDPSALEPAHAAELALLRRWASGDTLEPLPPALRRALQASHCPVEPGPIRHLLVDLGQWGRHHLPSLEATTWQLGFSGELLAAARDLVDQAERAWPGDDTRLDLTHLHTVTIDDDDTQDIDDGLSLEEVEGAPWLWIHIADPGRLVEAGSPLDREARRRASSLYLAAGSQPMFPLELSTGPFSLRHGRRCAAWSLAVRLDGDGAVAGHRLERSWIRPDYRLSYADADELIELAPPQERWISSIDQLTRLRRSWRQRRGALLMDQAEGRIRCRDDRPELEIVEPSPSRLMVAEAMILAGAVIADLGRQADLPLPYRSQAASALPSDAELEALPPGPVRHAALRRCLSRGHMGCTPAPHFSLGLEAYVQATSPIRRYGDLVVQRQLLAHREGGPVLGEDALSALLTELEGPLRQGIQISRDDQRHWQQVYFEQSDRPQWQGTFLRWLRPQDQLGLVHVEELAMDLPAECPPRAEPGDALVVRVQQVDSLRDLLRLQATA